MIHRFVFHNDEVKPLEKTRWSPGQAGLICGWGLFTTVRIVRGEAFAYERHWRRLEKDAALIRLPLTYSGARVRVQLQELIRTNKVKEGCARIYLVWNTVGRWKSDEKMAEVDLVITTRGVLMEIAAEAGTTVVEQAMRPEDLYAADEVFITSTNRNVIGVKEIAGRIIGAGVGGELTKKLDAAFEAYLNDYVDRRLAASG